MRNRYLLCYDVREDTRLRRAAKVAESYGYRVQYSVFICDLSDVERVGLESSLRRVLRLDVDSVLIVDLGSAGKSSQARFRWLGARPELYDSAQATVV